MKNVLTVALFSALAAATSQPATAANAPAPMVAQDSSREAARLADPVQLTFPDRFHKAGEAYFSPDGARVIFQAVEKPEAGAAPSPFYGMYVADLVSGINQMSLANIRRISPEGSANTCGWFHPTDSDVVIFGSTIGPPTQSEAPGFQRKDKKYSWMFPPQMNIVRCNLAQADGTARTLETLLGSDEHYIAECSISPDGRHLLFCSLESGRGDLFVMDLETGAQHTLVTAPGYDGGPFFSPDGKRICYRSDRKGNNLLQLFVGELAFDDDGVITGLEREFQLTDNGHVNWCPYWHPNGRYLVYATSEEGHSNYEVFIVDADPGSVDGEVRPVRYGTRRRRVTEAARFDGLPVFDASGKWMMWTSQRGEGDSSQLWMAEFVMDPEKPVAVDHGHGGAHGGSGGSGHGGSGGSGSGGGAHGSSGGSGGTGGSGHGGSGGHGGASDRP